MHGGMEIMSKSLRQHEDEAIKIGNSWSESRNDSFYEGKTPALVNVHEAYLDRKISMGEAQDLNPKYNPDKVVGGYKKNGKSYPKTQGAALSSSVQQRKKKKGL
jgi:hypothetical protein